MEQLYCFLPLDEDDRWENLRVTNHKLVVAQAFEQKYQVWTFPQMQPVTSLDVVIS